MDLPARRINRRRNACRQADQKAFTARQLAKKGPTYGCTAIVDPHYFGLGITATEPYAAMGRQPHNPLDVMQLW